MKHFSKLLFGSLFLLSGYAMGQFTPKFVQDLGAGTFDKVDPNAVDITGASVSAVARDSGAPQSPNPPVPPYTGNAPKILTAEVTPPVLGHALTEFEADPITGNNDTGNSTVLFSMKGKGAGFSRTPVWNAGRWGSMAITRSYRVKLPPGSDFGVIEVDLLVFLGEYSSLTGSSSASVSVAGGSTMSVSFQGYTETYIARGVNVGFLSGQTSPTESGSIYSVGSTLNGSVLEREKHIKGYLLVHHNDIISLTTEQAIDSKNSNAINDFISGTSSGYSSGQIRVHGYDKDIQGLEYFPKNSEDIPL